VDEDTPWEQEWVCPYEWRFDAFERASRVGGWSEALDGEPGSTWVTIAIDVYRDAHGFGEFVAGEGVCLEPVGVVVQSFFVIDGGDDIWPHHPWERRECVWKGAPEDVVEEGVSVGPTQEL